MKKSSGFRRFMWFAALICLLGGAAFFYLYKGNPIDYIPYLQNRLSDEVQQLDEEAEGLSENFDGSPIKFDEIQDDLSYGHFVYENGEVVYWSDYRYVPDYETVACDYTIAYRETVRHQIVSVKRTLNNGQYEMYSIIPLSVRYKIDNNYVHSGYNSDIFGTGSLQISNGGAQVCVADSCLFGIVLDAPLYRDSFALVSVTFFWLAFVLLTAGMTNLAWATSRRGHFLKGLLLLCAYFIGIRALMLVSGFPGSVYQTDLFDSRLFASSAINPSLGDLFLNLLSAAVTTLYCYSFLPARFQNMANIGSKGRLIAGILCCGFLLFTFHYQYLFLQTLYNNSQLSFDINLSIQFDLLRIAGFAIIILNAILAFLWFHILILFVERTLKIRRFSIVFLTGSLLFAAINLILDQAFLIPFLIAVCYGIVLWRSRLFFELEKIRFRSFLYLFTGIIATSLLVAFTIRSFEHTRELNQKTRFADQFLIENDNLAEFLLSEALENISDDVFIQSRLSSPFMSKDIVRSKIRQIYLSNYFDKYDVRIHLYNPNFEPYDIPADISPREIRSWRTGEYATGYNNIFFINELAGKATKRYLALVPISKRGITVGYILIDMALKRIIPDNVYPELLVDNRFLQPYENTRYSYAVMEEKQITYHAGEFNYQKMFLPGLLDKETLYNDGLEHEGYDHLAVRDRQGRIVVISSKEHPVDHLVSNFSFLFLLLVSLVLIFSGLYALYYYYRNVDLSYTARIQLYLNVAFFLPLIAVSITTLSVINSSFRQDQREEYYSKAENISENMSDDLEKYLTNLTTDLEDLSNQLNLIGKVTGVDVNIFSVRGKKVATSQPLIYENELLSEYINPQAMEGIRDGGETFQIVEESVGSLTYNNTFFGIRSFESGQLIGMLSIPFFQSANELERNQIEVLTNVMNIFTVIFIILLILSSLASEWLTFPLRFITQKLKKTTLTGFNEPLVWNSEDEIGLMVSEYNRMLVNLEDSKKALARSQKETAWREIAQQVAHEIKNPLTPMKLTLQHLSRRMTEGQDELKKPVNSLLQQVDTLSDIASSFSAFAKLPIPEHERFELTAVLRSTAQLYANSEEVTLTMDLPEKPVYCMGDANLMGRIISNIILNAIQAHTGGKALVDLRVSMVNQDKVLIEIRDNGSGIDESIHSKIFIPNFTTKESGSGIGLAVAKHGVEHAGGKIWFESEVDRGTVFMIELPALT